MKLPLTDNAGNDASSDTDSTLVKFDHDTYSLCQQVPFHSHSKFSVSQSNPAILTLYHLISLYSLREKIASLLNVHTPSLHIQYRFSTDSKDTLPCDLITHAHFVTLLRLLRERSVPGKTASGRPSTRKMRQYMLQVFNKGDSPFGAENKVCIPY